MEPVYLTPGFKGKKVMPHSEVCMHMGIAGKEIEFVFDFRKFVPYVPYVQLYKNGYPYSSSITPGEAGIFQDEKGFYFYPPPN